MRLQIEWASTWLWLFAGVTRALELTASAESQTKGSPGHLKVRQLNSLLLTVLYSESSHRRRLKTTRLSVLRRHADSERWNARAAARAGYRRLPASRAARAPDPRPGRGTRPPQAAAAYACLVCRPEPERHFVASAVQYITVVCSTCIKRFFCLQKSVKKFCSPIRYVFGEKIIIHVLECSRISIRSTERTLNHVFVLSSLAVLSNIEPCIVHYSIV